MGWAYLSLLVSGSSPSDSSMVPATRGAVFDDGRNSGHRPARHGHRAVARQGRVTDFGARVDEQVRAHHGIGQRRNRPEGVRLTRQRRGSGGCLIVERLGELPAHPPENSLNQRRLRRDRRGIRGEEWRDGGTDQIPRHADERAWRDRRGSLFPRTRCRCRQRGESVGERLVGQIRGVATWA